jgi:cytochrome c1
MRLPLATIAATAVMGACLVFEGCTGGQTKPSYSLSSIGNPQHGKELISSYGCGACHIVPGVRSARGLVGPPLFDFSERTMIAGELPNTPPNLVRWIQNPKIVEPNTAMPDLGLSQQQAYDIAAYLYTLRSHGGNEWTE